MICFQFQHRLTQLEHAVVKKSLSSAEADFEKLKSSMFTLKLFDMTRFGYGRKLS